MEADAIGQMISAPRFSYSAIRNRTLKDVEVIQFTCLAILTVTVKFQDYFLLWGKIPEKYFFKKSWPNKRTGMEEQGTKEYRSLKWPKQKGMGSETETY